MSQLGRTVLLTSTLFILGYPLINGFLVMRPLSAREVYRLLSRSGHSDAIPEGRIITNGLAAMSGFALGLKKSIGAIFLYDVITANVTESDLNGTNGNGNGNNSTNPRGTKYTAQELCFNSRNARSLEEAEAIAEAYSRDDTKRKIQLKVRPSEAERHLTLKRRNKRKSLSQRKPSRLALKKPEQATGTGTQTDIGTDSMTETTSPTLRMAGIAEKRSAMPNAEEMRAATSTGSANDMDNGANVGTTSTSTTSTGRDGAINCVVIEKPPT